MINKKTEEIRKGLARILYVLDYRDYILNRPYHSGAWKDVSPACKNLYLERATILLRYLKGKILTELDVNRLLGLEERNRIANEVNMETYDTSVDYWNAIIQAELQAQLAKDKMVEGYMIMSKDAEWQKKIGEIFEELGNPCPHGTQAADTSPASKRECYECMVVLRQKYLSFPFGKDLRQEIPR